MQCLIGCPKEGGDKIMDAPILSLCLPTNGVMGWVLPALESIYTQEIDTCLFEVVVTNNGDDCQFDDFMLEYAADHKNLIYKKTDAYMFHNQLEALKLASGDYLKLINHRSIMQGGSLAMMLSIIKENLKEKPVLYFSNGVMSQDYSLNTFDEFVRTLGKYASWTTGVGIWKSDYDNLPIDMKIDNISPHSCILFAIRKGRKYKIENFVFAEDITQEHSKKGNYDLFKAFGVEEVMISQNLYIDGDITATTFKKVKNDYKKFVSDLYFDFIVRKKICSYDLNGFDDAMGVYFNKYDIIFRAYVNALKRVFVKLWRQI